MGKGSNVSKANKSREQAAKRAAEEGKGGGGAAGMAQRNGALSVVCQICRTSFMATQSKAQLQAHVDAKHAAGDFDKCAPAPVRRESFAGRASTLLPRPPLPRPQVLSWLPGKVASEKT